MERTILKNLYSRNLIGAKHTALRYAISGIPKHKLKKAKKTLKELFNERLIIPKNTNYGLQVSLNPEKLDEIKKRLQK